MIAVGHIVIYRDGQKASIGTKLTENARRQRELELEGERLRKEARYLSDAAERASHMPARNDVCPKCKIWADKDVALIAVPPPEGADDEVDYFVCGARCGFDNLP